MASNQLTYLFSGKITEPDGEVKQGKFDVVNNKHGLINGKLWKDGTFYHGKSFNYNEKWDQWYMNDGRIEEVDGTVLEGTF